MLYYILIFLALALACFLSLTWLVFSDIDREMEEEEFERLRREAKDED